MPSYRSSKYTGPDGNIMNAKKSNIIFVPKCASIRTVLVLECEMQ